ncbi:Sec63-domain-containing protein [Pholiota conissans]|uniref:Sec63-domain-containing protein n=1 Tax=Pholiota conissans TaxID=109636 RepID=A0A9P5YNY8_9AGAR|nr:Sec63-domain-containing protein [Pholiota conissans]
MAGAIWWEKSQRRAASGAVQLCPQLSGLELGTLGGARIALLLIGYLAPNGRLRPAVADFSLIHRFLFLALPTHNLSLSNWKEGTQGVRESSYSGSGCDYERAIFFSKNFEAGPSTSKSGPSKRATRKTSPPSPSPSNPHARKCLLSTLAETCANAENKRDLEDEHDGEGDNGTSLEAPRKHNHWGNGERTRDIREMFMQATKKEGDKTLEGRICNVCRPSYRRWLETYTAELKVFNVKILVVTPKKWDVITHKQTNTSYTNLRLIIIDEIHFLHNKRGPVLESIMSRMIRRWSKPRNTYTLSLWYLYFDVLTPPEIGELIGIPNTGRLVHRLVHNFTKLQLQVQVRPITRSLLCIDLSIFPHFRWDEKIHGGAETFLILIEDVNDEVIVFHDTFVLHQRYAEDEHNVTLTVPHVRTRPSELLYLRHFRLIAARRNPSTDLLQVPYLAQEILQANAST